MSAHWSRVATETQQYFNRLGVFLDRRQARVAGALMYYGRPMSTAVLNAIVEEPYSPAVSPQLMEGLRRKLEPTALKVRELEDGRYYTAGSDKLPDFPILRVTAKALLLALTLSFLGLSVSAWAS